MQGNPNIMITSDPNMVTPANSNLVLPTEANMVLPPDGDLMLSADSCMMIPTDPSLLMHSDSGLALPLHADHYIDQYHPDVYGSSYSDAEFIPVSLCDCCIFFSWLQEVIVLLYCMYFFLTTLRCHCSILFTVDATVSCRCAYS
jgi:hypothetical protein